MVPWLMTFTNFPPATHPLLLRCPRRTWGE